MTRLTGQDWDQPMGPSLRSVTAAVTLWLPARQIACSRTHDFCHAARNRRRTMNRLTSAQVTHSRCVFFASPR